jgi:hypothetical protein
METHPTRLGPVTEHLRTLLARQVAEHSLVFWYDPEGHYGPVAAELSLSSTEVALVTMILDSKGKLPSRRTVPCTATSSPLPPRSSSSCPC